MDIVLNSNVSSLNSLRRRPALPVRKISAKRSKPQPNTTFQLVLGRTICRIRVAKFLSLKIVTTTSGNMTPTTPNSGISPTRSRWPEISLLGKNGAALSSLLTVGRIPSATGKYFGICQGKGLLLRPINPSNLRAVSTRNTAPSPSALTLNTQTLGGILPVNQLVLFNVSFIISIS